MDNSLVKVQALQERLKRYTPDLIGESKLIASWIGPKIKSLNEDQYFVAINAIVAEVCLLCGLETYDAKADEVMYKAQMRQISKFIMDGYSMLTPDEILNSFHLNLQGKYKEIFKDYGKRKINCEFIGQVLSAYVVYKKDYMIANEDLEKVLYPDPEQKAIEYQWTEQDEDNSNREMVEGQYQQFKTDPQWNYQIMISASYDILVKDKLIEERYWELFYKDSKITLAKVRQIAKMQPSAKDFNRIGKVLQKHFDHTNRLDSEIHQIRNGVSSEPKLMAKKMAVAQYFKDMLAKGFMNIYIPT